MFNTIRQTHQLFTKLDGYLGGDGVEGGQGEPEEVNDKRAGGRRTASGFPVLRNDSGR